jgi:hypothetical protein
MNYHRRAGTSPLLRSVDRCGQRTFGSAPSGRATCRLTCRRRDVAHDGQHAELAVADLFVAVTLRPRFHPGGAVARVEVVGDQLRAGRPAEVGGAAAPQPFDQLGGFGDRLLPRARRGITAAALLPPNPPIAGSGPGNHLTERKWVSALCGVRRGLSIRQRSVPLWRRKRRSEAGCAPYPRSAWPQVSDRPGVGSERSFVSQCECRLQQRGVCQGLGIVPEVMACGGVHLFGVETELAGQRCELVE